MTVSANWALKNAGSPSNSTFNSNLPLLSRVLLSPVDACASSVSMMGTSFSKTTKISLYEVLEEIAKPLAVMVSPESTRTCPFQLLLLLVVRLMES